MEANRRTVVRGIGAGTALLVGGVGASTAEEDEAALRVAHAAPDVEALTGAEGGPVDVYLDGSKVVAGLPFREVTGYLEFPAGEYDITVTAADDPETVAFAAEDVPLAAEDYTAVAQGELTSDDSEFTVSLLEDTNGANLGGDEARVRAIHASPDAPAVDVTASTDGDDDPELVVFDGVEPLTSSGYATVPAGVEFDLQVRADTASDDGPIVDALEDVELEGRSTYTVFAVGYLDAEDEPTDEAFGLVPVLDRGAPPRGNGRGGRD